tara:strand:- start:1847 stop:2593 length:747 start_codon:yes stop_codon:yes gene_type:complete
MEMSYEFFERFYQACVSFFDWIKRFGMIEKVVQFLVCPQVDFIGRLDHGQDLPNALHVGHEACAKLRGTSNERDPFVETVSKFFDDSTPGSEKLQVILDEDWHSKSCAEFEVFGEHCVKGTRGAALPSGVEKFRYHPRCEFIHANSINIASDSRFAEVMEETCGRTKPQSIRAGVIGVWTHVKVEYLMVSLNTIAPCLAWDNIGVCEPLCASPEQTDHDQAIKKFKAYGAQVYYDCDTYCRDWLQLDG